MQKGASNASARRSTSGGVLIQVSHYIKSLSKTQSLVALSSAKSDLYALVNASAEANALSIGDQRPGTVVEHDRVQRRQRSLGCGTTSKLGKG